MYRYLYKMRKPQGIHDLQRGLGLSSTSVATYHVKKLLEQGLIKEQDGGYVVDRVLFENMIRISSAVIPFETTYTIFFVSTVLILITVYLPQRITSVYLFAVFVNIAALAFFLFETLKAYKSRL